MRLSLRIDGHGVELGIDPLGRLSDVLGTFGSRLHRGDEGGCGRCRVLVDGVLVHACHVPAVQLAQVDVVTAAGLLLEGRLRSVERGLPSSRCVHCTPGLMAAAAAALADEEAGEQELTELIGEDTCGCGSAARFLERVKSVRTAIRSRQATAQATQAPRRTKRRRKVMRTRSAARKALEGKARTGRRKPTGGAPTRGDRTRPAARGTAGRNRHRPQRPRREDP